MSRAEILSFSCGHGDEGCFTDLTMALCLSRILETSGFTTSASPHHCRSLSSTSTSAATVWRASSGSSVLTTCRVKYIQLFKKKCTTNDPYPNPLRFLSKFSSFPYFTHGTLAWRSPQSLHLRNYPPPFDPIDWLLHWLYSPAIWHPPGTIQPLEGW